MAQRRMFSPSVVGGDDFLDLPISSQALYFHLGMYADDDGFVAPKKIIRMIGAAVDDLKLLVAKSFVIPFDSGVIVISHWRRSNLIKNDRYKPTIYQDEYQKLQEIRDVYYLYPERNQNGSNGVPKVRLGKVSTGKDNTIHNLTVKEENAEMQEQMRVLANSKKIT